MTTVADPYGELTAEGGPFPLVAQVVDGRQMQVFDRAPRTLAEAFLATQDHFAAEAIVYQEERYTYGDQWRLVVVLAGSLQDRFGIGPGDRVAIAMRNYPEWVFTFWAVTFLGGVVVPLNAWSTGTELVALLQDCGATLLVADAERANSVIALEGAPIALTAIVTVRGDCPGTVPFDELIAEPAATEIQPYAAKPEDVATILFTSGTTGRPKGVIGTHRNHSSIVLIMRLRAEAVRRARVVAAGSRADSGSAPAAHGTTLIATPLFHIAALTALTSNAYAGRRVVLMYRWNVDEALRIIAAERVSEMSGPPLIVREIVDAVATEDHDTSSLMSLVCGAAPAPPQLIRDIGTVFGGRVSPGTGYGSTETTSTVLTITGADYIARPTSVGRPLPTIEIQVRDEDGRLVMAGGVGELEVRGPQIARGYDGKPSETAASFAQGWYRTGDKVRLDEDGFVHLVGRLKDIVIRGGENVQCAEVELAVQEHPDILETAVVGRAHATLGEEVMAVVRLRPGGRLDERGLADFLRDRLAPYKIPSVVWFTTDPLPRNASGKVIKAGLAAARPETSWT
jgi:long-chain acyl-CoA synthetase